MEQSDDLTDLWSDLVAIAIREPSCPLLPCQPLASATTDAGTGKT